MNKKALGYIFKILASFCLALIMACGSSSSDEPPIEPVAYKQKISNIIVTESYIIFAVEVADRRFELFNYSLINNKLYGISDIFSANTGLRPAAICPYGNHIAYRGDRDYDGFDELYSNSMDGSNEVLLADEVSSQTVSSEGVLTHYNWQWVEHRVVFRSDPDNDDIHEIQSVYIDGSDLIELSGELATRCFSSECWKASKTGTHVTFLVEDIDENSLVSQSLYSINADGTELVMLNEEPAADSRIHDWQWAPDDSSIAYISQDIGSPSRLYTILPDGTSRVLLNPNSLSTGVEKFSWSTDSNSLRLAFTDDTTEAARVSLYNNLVDGSDRVHLIDTFDVAFPNIVDWQWSPDSSRIGYRADQEAENVTELFTVEVDGEWHRKMHQTLAIDPQIQTPWLWSFDSQYISFFAEMAQDKLNDELYISAADGSSGSQVNLELGADSSIMISDKHWLKNSSRVLYQVTIDGTSVEAIYSVLPDGTDSKLLTPELNDNQTISDWYLASPTSDSILFQVTNSSENTVSLQRASVDASIKNNIENVGIASQAKWFVDGSRIVYVYKATPDSSEALYSVLPDGSGKIKLY